MCSCKHRHTSHVMFHLAKSLPIQITLYTLQTVLYLEFSDPLHILGLMYFLTKVTPSSFCWLTLLPLLTSCLTSDSMVDERWVFIWCIEIMSTPDKHTDRRRSEKQKKFRTEVTWQSSCVRDQTRWDLSVSSFSLKWRMYCSVSHVWGNQSSPLGKRDLLDKASDQHNIRCGVGRPEIVGVLTVMMNELSDSSPEKCVCFSGSHWLILRLK